MCFVNLGFASHLMPKKAFSIWLHNSYCVLLATVLQFAKMFNFVKLFSVRLLVDVLLKHIKRYVCVYTSMQMFVTRVLYLWHVFRCHQYELCTIWCTNFCYRTLCEKVLQWRMKNQTFSRLKIIFFVNLDYYHFRFM